MPQAFISLGSNMGNKLSNLQEAIDRLGSLKDTSITALSSVYRTAPVGNTEQDWFLNAIARLETALLPRTLLAEILAIEDIIGRVRTIRWGPRVIDLDLVLYDNEEINEEKLIIPHPRMIERAFVLVPLLEIDSYLSLPSGVRLNNYLKNINVTEQIFKISENLSCK